MAMAARAMKAENISQRKLLYGENAQQSGHPPLMHITAAGS